MNKFTHLLTMLFCLYACSQTIASTHKQYFTENKGQWEAPVLYRADMSQGSIFLEKDQLTYLLYHPDDMAAIQHQHAAEEGHAHDHHHETPEFLRQHAFRMQLVDAKQAEEIIGDCSLTSYRNYFIGNDPSKWAAKVATFKEINYHEIYEGIQWRIYGQEDHIKYDFIIAAHADAQQIKMRYTGVDAIEINELGALEVHTSVNTLIEKPPFAYQYIRHQLQQVPCHFSLKGNEVSFTFPEGYNPNYELIIDPELNFSTFTGSFADNFGFTATYDNNEAFYAGGIAFGTERAYPTTTGAFQEEYGGSQIDMGISKFSADGSELLYSTYLGGSNGNEPPHSLIVNSQNELLILGTTSSNDFPTTVNAFDRSFNGGPPLAQIPGVSIDYSNGSDIVVARLSEDGSELIASTYLGGSNNDGLNLYEPLKYNYADELRGEIFVDDEDQILIATCSASTDFPTSIDAYQSFNQGGQDGVVVKLTADLSDMIWGSMIGGRDNDAVYGVKINDQQEVYICGGTTSRDLFDWENALIPNFQGGLADAFVMRLSADGSELTAATYLGNSSYNQSYFIELDESGNVYTFGQTAGIYPVEGNVYQHNNSGQFIHKLNADLTETVWSTAIGNTSQVPIISPTAFLVDKCGRIYISGWGGTVNSSASGSTTTGLPTTANAYQTTTDGSDFYFLVLEAEATDLHYATFFGANGDRGEHVDGGTSRFSKDGRIYQAICACSASENFPTTPGVWSQEKNSSNCNLAAVKFSFDTTPTLADFSHPPNSCVNSEVVFTNTSLNAISYEWSFGDGTTSTAENPSHTYTEEGTYNVQLTAFNSASCNGIDMLVQEITITGNSSEAIPIQAPDFICEGGNSIGLIADPIGGTWEGIGITDAVLGTFDPTGLEAGAYEVSYTSMNSDGCTDISTIIIAILSNPELVGTTPICEANGSFTQEVTVIGADNDYTAYLDDGTGFEVLVTDNLQNTTAVSVTVDDYNPGDVLGIRVVGNDTGCESIYSFTAPNCTQCNLTIDVDAVFLCGNGDPYTIPFITDADPADVIWEINGEVNPNGNIFDPFDKAEDRNFRIIASLENGLCNGIKDTIDIIVEYPPSITQVSEPMCLNDGTNLFEVDYQFEGETSQSSYTIIINSIDTIRTDVNGMIFTLTFSGDGQFPPHLVELIEENTGCQTNTFVNAFFCSICTDKPGSFANTDTLLICADESAQVSAIDVLPNESQEAFYVVHTNDTDSLGTLLAYNQTGEFAFGDIANAQFSTVYYISSVIAEKGEDGAPDQMDECWAINKGVPIVFIEPLDYVYQEHCNLTNGFFEISILPMGGLPAFDPSQNYLINGIGEAQVAAGETYFYRELIGLSTVYNFQVFDESGCDLLERSSDSPLICNKRYSPIELVDFEVVVEDGGNHIFWATATETNNHYFTLERSYDGINYEVVTQVSGAGNSSRANRYEWEDPSYCATVYYRISWTDFDGVSIYSHTLQAQRNNVAMAQLFPNPTQDLLQLRFPAYQSGTTALRIFDVTGRIVHEQTLYADDCAYDYALSVANWPQGVYLVKWSGGEVLRFVRP